MCIVNASTHNFHCDRFHLYLGGCKMLGLIMEGSIAGALLLGKQGRCLWPPHFFLAEDGTPGRLKFKKPPIQSEMCLG